MGKPQADPDVTRVATMVPRDQHDALLDKARAGERSIAAELRLAIRAWVDQDQRDRAAA